MLKKGILLLFNTVVFGSVVLAQRDTTVKPSINITSSFKPVLRNAMKINLSGSQLNSDTNKAVRAYNIPSQNLFYSYQAQALNPLSIDQDQSIFLGNRNFLKAGFGNYTTPYLKAGLGFGDGKEYLTNVFASYTSSNGNIKNQDYSQLNVKATGSYFLPKHELYATTSTSREQYYLYGYDHQLYDLKRGDISQQFQQINAGGGIRNTAINDYRINYDPNFNANFFTSRSRLSETTLQVNLPAEKRFGEKFNVSLFGRFDLTRYNTKNFQPANFSSSNNVTQFTGNLKYSSGALMINAGITPYWDNGEFEYLPNVIAEAKIKDKVFMVQAGAVGRVIKNTFRNLSAVNPFLTSLINQVNTRELEFYGGIKASLGNHFNFNARAGIVHFKNFALFINDYSAGVASENNFVVVYEPKMESLRIRGDISYVNKEKFSATAALVLNGYTGVDVNNKAWNTVPMEFTGSLRWWIIKDILLKGDFYLFGGGNYLQRDGGAASFRGGSDLNAGAEVRLTKRFSAFADVNNIFDNKYQRWHNYEVYGINAVGGIIFRF